jgi:hypothetical protein
MLSLSPVLGGEGWGEGWPCVGAPCYSIRSHVCRPLTLTLSPEYGERGPERICGCHRSAGTPENCADVCITRTGLPNTADL